MILNKLKILDPDKKDLDFIVGESRVVKYKIINESDFKMKDLEFSMETVLKDLKEVRKTVDSEDQMIATSFDHTIYELTGDMKELSQARKVNPLLDKKIVNRQVDAKINFSNLKSIEEELHTYLTKVKLMKDTDMV